MTAADHLTADVLQSADLWSTLFPLAPDEVTVSPAPRWMLALWSGGVSAMTIGSRIYVHPDFLARATANARTRLIVHELIHARQWGELGRLGFLSEYLADYVKGRLKGLDHEKAYREIRLEVAARDGAGSIL